MKRLDTFFLYAVAGLMAGCATTAPSLTPVVSGRISCTPLDYRDIRPEATEPQPSGSLTVPVVIHLMDRREDPEQTVLRFWAPQYLDDREMPMGPVLRKIATYFGDGEFSVNAIWRPASIRFDVRRVEWCRFTPPHQTATATGTYRVLPPEPALMREETPIQQDARIKTYLDWNAAYGVRRTLNVYLWPIIDGANGYGESPRRGRTQVEDAGIEALPTVWLSPWESCNRRPGDCQLKIAHELGHALGLKHVCRACDSGRCCADVCWEAPDYYYYCDLGKHRSCAPTSVIFTDEAEAPCCCGCGRADVVLDGLNACGEPVVCCKEYPGRERLMYEEADEPGMGGSQLCPGEVHAVRSAVREFFHNN